MATTASEQMPDALGAKLRFNAFPNGSFPALKISMNPIRSTEPRLHLDVALPSTPFNATHA
jgi:hypothetical protein